MSVSVVIPALNEAVGLSGMLPGLLQQPGLAEVIVADGGSDDETCMVANRLGAKCIATARGRAMQMNAGAALASGDILLFLHADTQLPVKALSMIEGAVAAGALWGRFDVRLSGSRWPFRLIEWMINWRSCWSGIATGDQAIFVCREQFHAIGGYAEIPLMEDVELSSRLKAFKRPCCIRTPLITSSRRWERHGITKTVFLMWRMRLAYFLGASPQTLAEQYRRSDTPGEGS